MSACVLRVLDCGLVQEWTRTCGEYSQRLRRPFQRISFARLWNCHQPNWEEAFTEWSVFQLWLSAFAIVCGQLLLAIAGLNIVQAVINAAVYIAISYLYAHLGWFAVVKRKGCCVFLICCFEGTVLLFVWGILCILLGAARFADALRYLGWSGSGLAIVNACLQGVYAVVMIYMGVCCLRIWQHPYASGGWWGRDVAQQREGAAPPPATEVGAAQEWKAPGEAKDEEAAKEAGHGSAGGVVEKSMELEV